MERLAQTRDSRVAHVVNVLKWSQGKFLPEREAQMTPKFETYARPADPHSDVDRHRKDKDLKGGKVFLTTGVHALTAGYQFALTRALRAKLGAVKVS